MKTDIFAPDLGGDDAYPVVELIANVGDTLAVDDPILVLESDKASMEVPATCAGELLELKVAVGDTISSGDLVAIVNATETNSEQNKVSESPVKTETSEVKTEKASSMPVTSYTGKVDVECEMMVLGSGPGGYSAAFRSADLGMKTVIVEREATLGGVCLNVGCIPSKALLHVAETIDEAKTVGAHGVIFNEPAIDLDALRVHKDAVVGKLTGGIAGMAKGRKVDVVRGEGQFIDAHHIEVTAENGSKQVVKFAKAIIAAGSSVVELPFMPDDARIVDSTGALELRDIPEHMLVIGGGIIGMEMATVYSSLGSKISVVELSPNLMPGADPDLIKPWLKENKHRFEDVLLETKVVAANATDAGIEVTFEGKSSDTKTYDMVLVAVGRRPNGGLIGADKAGVNVDERGFIGVDKQMRTNIENIYAIGDLVGQPMLAHKAVHEGHVAAEAAFGEKSFFDAHVIPSVAYTSPEVAFAGVTETQAKAEGIAYEVAVFPWAASGKAIANNTSSGFTKLLFDPATKRILGGGVVGAHAGDLIAEICLAVEMGADATDIGKTIHPHPTLSESVGMAAEVYEGHCTDLPPKKKRK